MALLKWNVVVLSGDNYWDIVSSSQCQPCDELLSDQEEADTKVVLHAMRFLSENKEESVCIRSPSRDIDILVIALGMIIERSRVVFDYGNGTYRKQIWLNVLKLPVDLCQALIGFHSLTGNDCVIIFSERQRYLLGYHERWQRHCWSTHSARTELGPFRGYWKSAGKVCLQVVVWIKKELRQWSSISTVQAKIKKGVTIDLSLLPPSKSTLHLHFERPNYIARIWKLAGTAMASPPSLAGSGWDVEGDVE